MRLHNHLLRHVPNKRLMMARLAGALGVLRCLEAIARWREPVVVVLTYHRIATPGDATQPYYDPVISATPGAFREQVRLLARRFHVLTLEELARLQTGAEAHRCLKRPGVLITFDDGYRDNFETALPILQSNRVPATFFIPTRFLENPALPWWDHVAYVLKSTEVSKLCLARFDGDTKPIHIELGVHARTLDRSRAIQTTVDHFLTGSITDHPWFLDQLNRQARVSVDTRGAGCELFMGWHEVKELSLAGMSIGSHSHSHLVLGELDEVLQRTELTTSRRLLKSVTGKDVYALAYPFGWSSTYSRRTQELATEVGYRLGFSSIEGINSLASLHHEPMSLRRLNVGTGDSPLLLRARVLSHATLGRSLF